MRLLRGTPSQAATATELVAETVEEPCADACCATPDTRATSTYTTTVHARPSGTCSAADAA
jgi:hypothetical protein